MSIPQPGASEIENFSQLVAYLEAGCKPNENWRIGTEHEKFGYSKDTLLPLPYEGNCSILEILRGLSETFGWHPLIEDDCLIGLQKDGANVSLEPGGQLELSGALKETVHQTCLEVSNHLAEVKTIADRIGAGFIGLGAAPVWLHHNMPVMPKGRYSLMTPYMDSVDSHGTQMMYRTCTVQVNLDFSSESDMVKKLRVGLALQPIATALFASSPFFEGKKTPYKSWRARIWKNTDSSRTGMLPFVFEKNFGFESWANYALDVPMYFVYRNGKYINALGQSFRDFLDGKLPALPGEKPTMGDWADHLTTIFPEVRLKQFIEMRGADAGPWSQICALPAFWVGLMYDSSSLDGAWEICKDWSSRDRQKLYDEVPEFGFKTIIRDREVQQIATEILALSREGLKNRAKGNEFGGKVNEVDFLDPLMESLSSGRCLADEILHKYEGNWNGNLSRIYSEYSY